MKHKLFLFIIGVVLIGHFGNAQPKTWAEVEKQKHGILQIYFYTNPPFAQQTSNEKLYSGIELDILKYFRHWLYKTKGVDIQLQFFPFNDYDKFLNQLELTHPNVIGSGAVTINKDRQEHFQFSSPYLKNTSVLVSHGKVPTVMKEEEFPMHFSGLVPVTIKGSIHEKYLIEFLKKYQLNVVPEYVESPSELFAKLKSNSRYYGYVDVITFWSYVKQNKDHFIKMHKLLNKNEEYFAFIMQPGSDWNIPLNEFFEKGFGFTATKEYHSILDKHLGPEIIKYVELE